MWHATRFQSREVFRRFFHQPSWLPEQPLPTMTLRSLTARSLATDKRGRCERPPWLPPESPAVTATGGSESRSFDRWRGELRRRCSVFRYGGRKHDSAPDSCIPTHLVS